jgi:quercetin dioxygenase-like cupin family protein
MFYRSGSSGNEDAGPGILLRKLGAGQRLSAVHWNLRDGSVVERHQHPQEQFGYVIKGGFTATVGAETAELSAGDAYYIPPDTPHRFVARGETEAIDVFTPIRVVHPSQG